MAPKAKPKLAPRGPAPEKKAAPSVVHELPPVADRGAMSRAIAPLLEGKAVHPDTHARIVEQTSKYAEYAVKQAFREAAG